jgi:hypothetical protein
MSGIRDRAVVLALALVAGAAGCGAPSEPSGQAQVQSATGAFSAMVSSLPDPPSVGEATAFDLAIQDAEGARVTGATLAVFAWMPVHGHSIDAAGAVSELGQGLYRIDGVAFTMPGRWELRIDVSASATEDSLSFPVDVR